MTYLCSDINVVICSELHPQEINDFKVSDRTYEVSIQLYMHVGLEICSIKTFHFRLRLSFQ